MEPAWGKPSPSALEKLSPEKPKAEPTPGVVGRYTRIGLSWATRNWFYILLAIIAFLVILFWVSGESINPETDDAQVDGDLIVISPRVPGYVQKMLIDDNSVVEQGDLMIQLDPADYQARVDQARAALLVAEARADSLKITVPFTEGTTTSATLAAVAQVETDRAELDRANATYSRLSTSELKFAEANIAARKAEVDKADSDVQRTRSLAEDSEISRQQFDAYLAVQQVARNDWVAAQQRLDSTQREADAAKAAVDAARSKVAEGEAEVRRSKSQELQSGVRKADYQSALADVQQAKATLTQAELDLSYTQIRAPVNGIVTKRTVAPGQQFAVGQAMFSLVPLDRIWITANFKETQMSRVRPGQQVRIDVDAYGHKTFTGVVESIARSTGSRQALLPPENATGNFVKVVQRIPVKIVVSRNANSGEILRVGMSVEVKIMTGGRIL
jgi:membrane fusion protein, multidrug efflux system